MQRREIRCFPRKVRRLKGLQARPRLIHDRHSRCGIQQLLLEASQAVANETGTVPKVFTCDAQGIGNCCKAGLRMLVDPGEQIVDPSLQRQGCSRRNRQQIFRLWRRRERRIDVLLNDDMRIGAPGAERTEPGQQRCVSGPGFGGTRQAEISVGQVQPGVFDFTVERRHPRLVLELQQDFNQTSKPGSRLQVPDIAFD
ncbi:hypothetical protein D3C80_987200 [compost metagenome]